MNNIFYQCITLVLFEMNISLNYNYNYNFLKIFPVNKLKYLN